MKKTITFYVPDGFVLPAKIALAPADDNSRDAMITVKWEEAQPASLESLIERVVELKAQNVSDYPNKYWVDAQNATIKEVVNILRTTPCIKAKALRKKGTDRFYCWDSKDSWYESMYPFWFINPIDDTYYAYEPDDSKYVDIEILINEP